MRYAIHPVYNNKLLVYTRRTYIYDQSCRWIVEGDIHFPFQTSPRQTGNTYGRPDQPNVYTFFQLCRGGVQYRKRSAPNMMRTDSAAPSPPRISHIGLVARSPEGHAAKKMQIRGHEDQWVDIQANTFRNWVNEHVSPSNRVEDLAEDLKDGRVLCELVENLQDKKIPAWSRNPGNRHQMLENVSKALAAIADDGVKLVNIGKCRARAPTIIYLKNIVDFE